MNNYAQYLEHFSNLSVAVVGDLMIDRYIFGQATRISPEAPVPIVLVQKENAVPGGAANVARNILSLHSKVAVFGSIGVDNSGKQLQELLQTAGANIDGVIIRSDFPTTEKIRLLADNQQIARIDRENTHALSEKKQEILLQKLENAIANHEIQAIILEDYAKGCLTFSFIEKIIRIAQQYNIFVTLDPHPANNFEISGLHLMTPNRKEAFALAKMPYQPGINHPLEDKALLEIGAIIMQTWQPKNLLITLGNEGMVLFKSESSQPLHIPTQAQQVFDVSGAGDTVMATMTLALLAGAPPFEAAAIANHAAGIVIGQIGTAAISYQTLLSKVQGQ